MMTQPDIKQWANGTSLYRSRVPAERANDPDVVSALARTRAAVEAGLPRLAQLGGMAD